jgi:tripartite-type tricarboxylate transporter receptor subunit TctC
VLELVKNKFRVLEWQAVAILAISFLIASRLSAQGAQPRAFDEKAAADFYRGKTVTVVVGFAPGGGYDISAD